MSHRLLSCALAATLALPAPALAQPGLLSDVRTGSLSLPTPRELLHREVEQAVSSGGVLYFQASSPLTGRELWRTDGTPQGTRMVVDLLPGPQGSEPRDLIDFNGALIFRARGVAGDELWKTDGTPQGTVRLLQPRFPWMGNLYSPLPFTRSGNTLFFPGPDGEPWKSDGTPQGTVRIKDIQPSEFISSGTFLMAGEGGSVFFFTADWQLWKSDGTEAGTVPVRKFDFLSLLYLQAFRTLGGTALFLENKPGRTQLWRSDGTEAGTQVVADLPALPNSYRTWVTTVAGGRLFLASNTELWVSDGTAAGSRALTSFTSPTSPPAMADLGGRLLYAQGSTLWLTDGPDGSVVQVAQLPQDQSITTLLAQGSQAYFLTWNASGGSALWKTDGTSGGTVPVKALDPNSSNRLLSLSSLRGDGGRFFFDLGYGGSALQTWVSDGTEAGTRQLTSTQQEPLGSWPSSWVASGPFALFLGEEGLADPSLWKTDGTAAGTHALAALSPATPTQGQRGAPAIAHLGDSVFLYSGDTLWKTDGTVAGTLAVRRFTNTHLTPELVRLADTLYFTASDGNTGAELWKSDGTEAGTVRVKDISAADFGSGPRQLRGMGGRLYFSATEARYEQNQWKYENNLWKSDGTEAGTVRVKDLDPQDAFGSGVLELHAVGNTLYFLGGAGHQLWRSDGTEAGTQTVALSSGSLFSAFHPLDAQTLYLQMMDTVEGGTVLWKLEGDAAPALVWRSSKTIPVNTVRGGFARARGGDVFVAWDPEHGLELWRTDGTQEGTAMLKDIWPGPDSGIRQYEAPETLLLRDQGLVLFAASDGESGEELWQTDGTPEGTLRVADVRPGPAGSRPRGLTHLGNTVLFSAVDEAAGVEPHALPAPVWTDRSPPALTCPKDVTDFTDLTSGKEVSYPPATATDLGGEPTVEYSPPSGSVFPVGTTQVTVTARDAMGLTRQCTFQVKVVLTSEDRSPFGCACGAGGTGPLALWSLLALMAGAVRRRRV
jgi:MYXO-CTERM domain-containing protein